jgi:inner membrane transporter RhtA
MSLLSKDLEGRRVGAIRGRLGTPPPTGLALLAIGSTQVGAAVAKQLFPALGPPGTVFMRTGFAALVLLLLWRPRLRGYRRSDYLTTLLFGLTLAGMNLFFYSALARIPLGIAVTLEFVGPLGVAVAASRRALDVLWVVLAGSGIVLLAPVGGLHLQLLGVVLALLAGGLWAAYILLSARVGRVFPGGAGLAIALTISTAVLLPGAIASAGTSLLDPKLLLVGACVSFLSSTLPYSLELEALRRLPMGVFGVLMSFEPAMAALVGFVILRQALGFRALTAIVLVTIATIGSSRFRQKPRGDSGVGPLA